MNAHDISAMSGRTQFKIAIIALIALVTIMYVLPDAIVAIYTTTLGTATALLIGAYIFFYKHWHVAIAYIAINIILWRIIATATTKTPKEGFTGADRPQLTTEQWPAELIRQFTQLQATINPQHIFDISQIQKYATPQEADYFMKHQQWEWDAPTETLYRAALAKNPMIADALDNSVAHARRLYSQGQIRQILFMQSPEGRAVIDGIVLTPPPGDPQNPLTRLNQEGRGTFAYTSGLTSTSTTQPLLQCDPATSRPVIVSPHGAAIDTHGTPAVAQHGVSPLRGHTMPGSIGLLTHARATWPKVTTPITDMADLRKYGFMFPDGSEPCNPCDPNCNFTIHARR
jgi:hypothetical protein